MLVIIPLVIIVCIIAWLIRPRGDISGYGKCAILSTALLSLVIAIAAVALQLMHNATGVIEVSDISNTLFIAGLCVIAVAALAVVGLAVAHKGELAKGAGFGACIAVIISVITLGLLEWLGGV